MRHRSAVIVALLCACTGTTDPGKGEESPIVDSEVAGETDLPGEDTEVPVDTEVVDPVDPNIDNLPNGLTWSWSSHPCDGNRVDTFVRSSDGRLWVGCGSDSAGQGLFVSQDDGDTWSTPTTSPASYFSTFRVNDVFEGTDGLLYIAGDQTIGGSRGPDAVVAIDLGADEPLEVTTVFATNNQVWNSFPVGTYRRLSTGEEVAESLTGTGAVWRASSEVPWTDGSNWALNGSYQILDLEVFGDAFYGVGSTIANPPMVYLPPESPYPGFAMDEVVLTDTFDGEMWDIVVDEQGILTVGVDQDADVGALFFTDGDGRGVGEWTMLRTTFQPEPTWLNGACRSGSTWLAVGRFSRTDEAFAILSTDAGESWSDVSPGDRPALYACRMDGDEVWVAGAGGAYGVLSLP